MPGDTRDTTTSRALATSLGAYAVDGAVDRLRRTTTGNDLVGAGVLGDRVVGDEPGSGAYGSREDVAVLTAPGRDPIVLAVVSSRTAQDAEHDDALLAAAAEVVAGALDRAARDRAAVT